MKVIHLIRHAESISETPTIQDFLRTLTEIGKRDSHFMAKKLNELNLAPDVIICSPAKRTTDTAKVFAKELAFDFDNIIFDKRIYESNLKQLLEILNETPNYINDLILIGHNPTLTQLSNYLTNDYIDNIPTCGIVKIELEIDDWQHIIEGIGRKIFFIYPKMF